MKRKNKIRNLIDELNYFDIQFFLGLIFLFIAGYITTLGGIWEIVGFIALILIALKLAVTFYLNGVRVWDYRRSY